MKITIQIPITDTREEFKFIDHPTKWKQETIEVTDELLFFHACKWGNKLGCKLFFKKKTETASYWHFVEGIVNLKEFTYLGH